MTVPFFQDEQERLQKQFADQQDEERQRRLQAQFGAVASAPGAPVVPTPAIDRLKAAGTAARPKALSQSFNDFMLRTGERGVNTLLLGGLPKLTGLVQGIGAILPGGRSPKEAYDQEKEASKERLRRSGKDYPLESLGTSVLAGAPLLGIGGVPKTAFSALKSVPLIGRVLPAAARAAANTGVGAGFGGAHALATAEGSPEEQVTQIAKGMKTGAELGLGAHAAFGFLRGSKDFAKFLGEKTGLLKLLRKGAPDVGLAQAAEAVTRQGTPGAQVVREAAPMQDAAGYTRLLRKGAPLPDAPPDLAPGVAHLGAQERLITQAGARVSPSLHREANTTLSAMKNTRRQLGKYFDEAVHAAPGMEPIPAAPILQQVPGALEPVSEAHQRIMEEAWRKIPIARRLTESRPTTVGDLLDQGRPVPQMIQNMLAKEGSNAAKIRALPMPGDGQQTRVPTLEWLHNIRKGLRAKLAKGFDPDLQEASDRVNQALEQVPGFKKASDHYRAISNQIQETEHAFGARWNKRLNRYEFPSALPGSEDQFLAPRAAGSLAVGSPAIAAVNLTASTLKDISKHFGEKGLTDAAKLFMQRGPRGYQALQDIVARAGRKPPIPVNRGGAFGGMLPNFFQPNEP